MSGSSAGADSAAGAADGVVASWKHIGLHGFAVGTLALLKDVVVWKSAVTGRDEEDGGGGTTTTTRKVSASKLVGASWTVVSKTGLVRLTTSDAKQHEWRLDGFPVADYTVLQERLLSLYQVPLIVTNLSSAGTQYGVTEIVGKLLCVRHCRLADVAEEGQEFEVIPGDELCSLDLTEVSQCVLPGNNRNELELQFPETDTMEARTDQLGACVCVVLCACVWAWVLCVRAHCVSYCMNNACSV